MTPTQRRIVFAMFIYTCIEGLVVNMMYPNPLSYLPKDVMIAFAYLGMLGSSQSRGGSVANLTGPFVVFALVCFLFVALPTPVSFMGVAVALKQRLFYIPLMFVGYHYTRGDADLAALLRVIALSSIPVSLFGTYLFFAGPSALTRMGATYSWDFYSTSGAAGIQFWRVPGTFNSPGQYGGYLYCVGSLMAAFLMVSNLRKKDRLILLAGLGCLLPAMLTSGSRAPLLLFFVSSGVVAMLSRKLTRAGILAAVAYFVLVISIGAFGAGVGDRVSSIATQENIDRFQGTFFGQLFLTSMSEDPIGKGLGTGTIGARHFSPEGTVELVESYFGLLVREMGAVGLLSFMVLAFSVGSAVFKGRRWMRQAPGFAIWNALLVQTLLTIVLMSNSTGVDGIPANLYFWFFVGVALKMVDLERVRLSYIQDAGAVVGR